MSFAVTTFLFIGCLLIGVGGFANAMAVIQLTKRVKALEDKS